MATTTITVNVAESQNYLATSRTISVSAISHKTQVPIPSQTNTLYFRGENGYEASDAMSWDSSLVQKTTYGWGFEVGTYQDTFRLRDTNLYEWSDGTITDKTVTWTISKANLDGTIYLYDTFENTNIFVSGIPDSRVGGSVTLASTYPTLSQFTQLPDFDETIGTISSSSTEHLRFYYENGWRYDSVALPSSMSEMPVNIFVDFPSQQNYDAIHLEEIAYIHR